MKAKTLHTFLALLGDLGLQGHMVRESRHSLFKITNRLGVSIRLVLSFNKKPSDIYQDKGLVHKLERFAAGEYQGLQVLTDRCATGSHAST